MTAVDDEIVIGIDLGTTYSCCGAWIKDDVEIIKDDQGKSTFPSYVCFLDDGKIKVGWEAKDICRENSTNTVFDMKRFIGRKFSEESVQNEIGNMPYEIVRLKNDEIGVKINGKEMRCEEISAIVLKRIKNLASKQLGQTVSKAVVTVPAYFNDAQRSATRRAAECAGLKVKRIINEPTAAALAYGLHKNKEENILMFDLGGGTFDVSLLNIDEGIFEVKSTSGNTHLGGEDFDSNMVERCFEVFETLTGLDARKDSRALRILRSSCEDAKCRLSSVEITSISVQNLFEGNKFHYTITRDEFEKLNEELFQSCLRPVEEAIREGKLSKEDIDEVILVGGSTRIPGIQKMLQEYFEGKNLCKEIDPDEAVAFGATVQCAIICHKTNKDIENILLADVLPISLGIGVAGGQMDILFSRNKPIPIVRFRHFTTFMDYQESVLVQVFEGERPKICDNKLLGQFCLEISEKLPRGEPKIKVKFQIDANGILKVSATEEASGNSSSIELQNTCRDDDEIQMYLRDEEENIENDEETKMMLESREGLRDFTLQIKNKSNQDVEGKLEETLSWLKENKNCKAEVYNNKQAELENYLSSMNVEF